MRILGITGGIGSGKSVVARVFETMGIPVYNTDLASKEISNSSQTVREQLSDKFGETIYKEGLLDRTMLALLVFSKPEYLKFVNSVIHPKVLFNFLKWKEQHTEKLFIGIETAVLFESGFDKWVDVSINIFAPIELRIQRVQKREGLDKRVILNRINNQCLDRERIHKADYTIVNDNQQAVLSQIENLIAKLQRC
ncbi:dephospho-CoA kinase [Candidatus Azobacteroides pseudotrichonymphae]|uniref:Dephospho-CoA kinase n=1 Tax=Azobacteroides pseudotrichonymphae genomovar. CFP2 TaxID=511995 RepID=B6YQF4_AZOPC|nr:dephospho-CoA kinase [Candidatus Azobacteroides pseudotrichonymphae]BAG83426.1 dephospho-CoA kinase [Candidatus Azobacteroides pseudotrichonymphae genomovar. CFP2]